MHTFRRGSGGLYVIHFGIVGCTRKAIRHTFVLSVLWRFGAAITHTHSSSRLEGRCKEDFANCFWAYGSLRFALPGRIVPSLSFLLFSNRWRLGVDLVCAISSKNASGLRTYISPWTAIIHIFRSKGHTQCFFFPWKKFFLSWKFLDFPLWKCEPSRENVLKTARENIKVPVKFLAKSLPWKQKMVGVKKMKISTREKYKSAREKKSWVFMKFTKKTYLSWNLWRSLVET